MKDSEEEPRSSNMALDYYNGNVLRTGVSTALRSSYSDRHGHHLHSYRRVQETLYRSNSSLELMQDHGYQNEAKPATPLLRREYGSHGSIDVIATDKTLNGTESLFEMFNEFKTKESEISSLLDEDKATSPKLRLKFGRFWNTSGNASVKRTSEESIISTQQGDEERQRRRAFAHYDCRSVTANLGYAARLCGLLLKRKNTTTGASAASMLCARSSTPDTLESVEDDQGDGTSNDLLESCPFFRNEIGGEEERVVGLMRGRSKRKNAPMHKTALACGISILEFPPGQSHWDESQCPYSGNTRPLEAIDRGAQYYRKFFYQQDHQNWFGMDENLGPVAISLRKEKVDKSNVNMPSQSIFKYRVLIRTSELLTLRGSVMEDVIPNLKPSSGKSMNTKEVLEYVAPEVQINCLRLGISGPQTEETLLKLDEQGLSRNYKVGIMYCKAGQSTEEQMYNNQDAGPAFTEFLETIGQKVRLKGFDKYKAGLDNKTDSTGLYSVYSQYQDCEIMFHVSTLLPFTPNNRQQLLRKRHIGNDIVTVVFQEPGAEPFTPKVIRSQFQHVFIVVRVFNPCTDNTHYRVAVTRSKEVGVFGPPIPEGGAFPKSKAFSDFLLAKIINAENAAHQSEKFATMATRTRQEYLKDLVTNYTTTTMVETNQKFSMLSFASKKKDRWRPRFLPDATQNGAMCWQVMLDDFNESGLVDCFLAISSDSFVLIEETSREVIFVTPCKAILGWSTNTNSLRLYFHQGECVTFHMKEGGERDELMEVVVRLKSVTSGSVAQELSLRRNPVGQLGFHVQPDGVVTQVETMGLAWTAGLKQGARLVEICKVAVSTLSHDQMVDLLKTSVAVTVTVIPPSPDGYPRRGCKVPNCKYSSNQEGDYENINSNDQKSNKMARQQAVTVGTRKRYERSFSPPRSSNSSGYGTGSSSKSSASERFNNSAESNGFSLLDPPHDFKVGEKVTCLMKAERSHELRRQLERNQLDYHLSQSEYNLQSLYKNANENEKPLSLTLDMAPGSTKTLNDDHLTDTSSNSERIFVLTSEDDLSGKSSPLIKRQLKHGKESPRGKDPTRESVGAKLRPGVTPRSQRNSANLQSSTLQQDLLRLIHPDYIPQGNETPVTPPKDNSTVFGKIPSSSSSGSLPDVLRSPSRENLSSLSLRSHSPPTKEKDTILTLARPATVISNTSTASSPAPSENKLSKDERLSPRMPLKSNILKSVMPDGQDMDCSSLVDATGRTMLQVKSDNANSVEMREEELSKHIFQLESWLSRETRKRMSLEEEVRSLREENRRLQQESQSAAQQLRRFTEWFFQTIDKQ
ncbi:signal-induced proliferation-associated 1-like protein 1 isoform X2 [Cimex lectularius]|uniref:Signal-induced proliferation-associated 1-like protein 2 n=1 Tax=Cimex lectularius TaxID=79782 RepID=A0A8I6S8A8_CIMLE|nr:signal-induced proliferation-associated 1-like protein 1 isoform X2 [Cimex lectularius]